MPFCHSLPRNTGCQETERYSLTVFQVLPDQYHGRGIWFEQQDHTGAEQEHGAELIEELIEVLLCYVML